MRCASKRLTDAEMETEAPGLRLAVHQQSGERIQLVAEVHADRTDRCPVAQAGTDVVAPAGVVAYVTAAVRPDDAAVDKGDTGEAAPDRRPQFRRESGELRAADRQPGPAQRRHFEAAPAAQVGCATEEVALEEWHADVRVARRLDGSGARLHRDHREVPETLIDAAFARRLAVVIGAAEEAAGLLDVERRHVPAFGVEEVVGGIAREVGAQRRTPARVLAGARIEA